MIYIYIVLYIYILYIYIYIIEGSLEAKLPTIEMRHEQLHAVVAPSTF